jgi:DNA-binding MurR/RpiR family transcriptional regulator
MAETLVKIRSLLEVLSPAEKSVAAYILRHASQVPLQSVRELARLAGVSHASVTRLSARLGCRTFRELKILLAQRTQASAISELYEALNPGDTDDEIVRKIFGGNIHSIQETLRNLDFEALRRAARILRSSRKIVFFGLGSSGNAAAEAALRFVQIDIEAEACVDSYQMLAQGVRMKDRQAAVGISHSGQSAVTIESLRLARRNGATTIGISNYPQSPLRRVCDLFLGTSFYETRVRTAALSSLLTQLCLIDVLFLLVARRRKDPASIEMLNQVTDKMLRAHR